jgi:flagellar biosynthesis/type III secretory pathway protein FliH
MSLRWQGPVLSEDVWPALNQGGEILAVARQISQDLVRQAEHEAMEILDIARAKAQIRATQDGLEAQRTVWHGVLHAWLGFVEKVHAQKSEAFDIALQAVKLVVKHLKLDASAEQQMTSNIALLLEQSVHNAAGEIRVCPEDVPKVQLVLNRLGCSNLLVAVDAAMSSGDCMLRCGELTFETRFENNVEVVLNALEQICSGEDR